MSRIFPVTRYTRNGGMRFLRIGRLQLSWCVCRSSLPRRDVLELQRAWLVTEA